MNRTTLCAVAMLLTSALPASGAPANKLGKKAPAPSKAAAPSKESEDYSRARANLLGALAICEVPDRCDHELLADFERQFVGACEYCSTTSACEVDRDQIIAGHTREVANPCSQAASDGGKR